MSLTTGERRAYTRGTLYRGRLIFGWAYIGVEKRSKTLIALFDYSCVLAPANKAVLVLPISMAML